MCACVYIHYIYIYIICIYIYIWFPEFIHMEPKRWSFPNTQNESKASNSNKGHADSEHRKWSAWCAPFLTQIHQLSLHPSPSIVSSCSSPAFAISPGLALDGPDGTTGTRPKQPGGNRLPRLQSSKQSILRLEGHQAKHCSSRSW